jgi:hypothetical protein
MALRKFLFQNQTEGFFEEQAATDEISLGKVTAVGVGGIAFDASSQRIVSVATPTAGTDAVNKNYVDSVATGLDVKQSVRLATVAALPANTPAGTGVGKTLTANANGALSVDGVAVAVGNRILVKNEAAADDNGIYTVTATGDGSNPYVLTRATDFDQDAEVTAGAFTFVAEGSTLADTGWVLTTNDPITVDTTSLAFSQFSSTTAYTFDQGLSNTAGSIKVELDTGADAQGAGAGGGSSGLEFDVNTAAGKLRAAVSATRAINRFGDGLGIEVDPQANTAGSNPSTAVSATGLTVVRSPKTEENYIASEAIAVGDPVAWSTTNNKLVKGRGDTDAKARIVGVARTAAAADTETLAVVSDGVAAGTLTGATAGDPYYLQDTGGVGTFAAITAGKRVIRVGFAKNATDLFVQVMDLGKKAA